MLFLLAKRNIAISLIKTSNIGNLKQIPLFYLVKFMTLFKKEVWKKNGKIDIFLVIFALMK